MQVRLLLGPAGSGKTFRCLSEVRSELAASPEGPPLVLLAPKQGTYQLEQQLLATTALAGYTRLSVVSFAALARLILNRLGQPVPKILTEEGRLMVLRGLLAEKRGNLKLFRASARLTGFAQQLSQLIGEMQRAQLTPEALNQLASRLTHSQGLALKLQDLATLLEEYLGWLESHNLRDEDALITAANDALRSDSPSRLRVAGLWADGFTEFSELELDLLGGLLPFCERATLTFCLDAVPTKKNSWLSHWSMVGRNLENCRKRFAALPSIESTVECLPRHSTNDRFSKSPVLGHLEECWALPRPYPGPENSSELSSALRLASCADPESEVTLAAREILAFARAGARFREMSVVVRNLNSYHHVIQRIFARFQIPFFLDRRESVAHHPLAELTRSAVRMVVFGWQQEDWFCALKSGLLTVDEHEVDLLENEALARGWKGQTWLRTIHLADEPRTVQEQQYLRQLEAQLEKTRSKIVPPFEQFGLELSAVNQRPTGPQLASAVRRLWHALNLEQRLTIWVDSEETQFESSGNLSVHETVWSQMNAWLDNAAMAFPTESLPLRQWLPILEAGLSSLTIGIIPPTLDQVLVGAVDRSRTPDVKLALVLGLNESVFPAKPDPGYLLTDTERAELEKHQVVLGTDARRQLGRERYLTYIACTRAGQRLVLTWAARDQAGVGLNPSSVVSDVRALFPAIEPELVPPRLDWRDAQHASELVGIFLKTQASKVVNPPPSAAVPGLEVFLDSLEQFHPTHGPDSITPAQAERLYGAVLRTSVSRMEQFAACPFRFFVHSGLRAEERKILELDIKEQGTFQHEVLARFHQQLRGEAKRWRDITPAQARERVGQIAIGLARSFRHGLLETSEETRFAARALTSSLQDFVETLVDWMQGQYRFDPVAVELPFGEDGGAPAWRLELVDGKALEIYGRIDRVDLYREANQSRAFCVVVDYKSSHKQLDSLLVEHGLQLQLLTYLNVLRRWPDPHAAFCVDQLEPSGVFYVNLRGKYGRERNRIAALADPQRDRKLAYRHSGRFDLHALAYLDARPTAREGDQFNYRRAKSGAVTKNSKEALPSVEFQALLAQVEASLKSMGQQIYAGHAEVGPYRRGLVTACDQCSYQAICRIDPWTHRFRVLTRGEQAAESLEVPGPSA